MDELTNSLVAGVEGKKRKTSVTFLRN